MQNLEENVSENEIKDPFINIDPNTFIKSHVPRIMPPPMQELLNYRASSKYDKKKLEESGFFRQSHVAEYINDKWNAESYNTSSFKSLYEMIPYIEKFHKESLRILYSKLLELKTAIMRTNDLFPALFIDFREYEIKQEPVQVEWSE